jgi:hypothetical protein
MPLTVFHVTQLGTLKKLFLSDDIAAIKNDTISLLPATSVAEYFQKRFKVNSDNRIIASQYKVSQRF